MRAAEQTYYHRGHRENLKETQTPFQFLLCVLCGLNLFLIQDHPPNYISACNVIDNIHAANHVAKDLCSRRRDAVAANASRTIVIRRCPFLTRPCRPPHAQRGFIDLTTNLIAGATVLIAAGVAGLHTKLGTTRGIVCPLK